MKTKEEIENEIAKNKKSIDKAKKNMEIGYFDGWNDALKWVLEDE